MRSPTRCVLIPCPKCALGRFSVSCRLMLMAFRRRVGALAWHEGRLLNWNAWLMFCVSDSLLAFLGHRGLGDSAHCVCVCACCTQRGGSASEDTADAYMHDRCRARLGSATRGWSEDWTLVLDH